ncbi:SDR family NAD(P)-dependent oxidoreductase [Pseudomonas monsensis]
MSLELSGRVALVTGASKGIGAGIAKGLAAAGAKVVVNFNGDRDGAQRVVAEIERKGGSAIAVQANIARSVEVESMVAEAVAAFGHLDILVNNAGIFEFMPLADVTEAAFHKQFDINVLGTLLVTQEAVKDFPPTGGSVINISSLSSNGSTAGSILPIALSASSESIQSQRGAVSPRSRAHPYWPTVRMRRILQFVTLRFAASP